jgi:hypothetical protein
MDGRGAHSHLSMTPSKSASDGDFETLIAKRSRTCDRQDSSQDKHLMQISNQPSVGEKSRNSSHVQFPTSGVFVPSYNRMDDLNESKAFLRVPEIVDTLAREGTVLKWNETAGWYEVLNGSQFEEKFNALRCTRGKRKEQAVDRPFARMHTYFVLVRGEKWAGTGSAFRPKINGIPNFTERCNEPLQSDDHNCKPAPDDMTAVTPCPKPKITADDIELRLRGSTITGSSDFTCSLQHFMDVTGAGELYLKQICKKQAESDNSPTSDSSPDVPVNDSSVWSGHVPDGILTEQDIARLVGSAWDDDSKGDQAYFFFREEGASQFPNGSIVVLRGGKLSSLHPNGCNGSARVEVDGQGGLPIYLVVSDKNAKWKGEPLPTPEEERLGHWCAFLGQVRARRAGYFEMEGQMFEERNHKEYL